jgi:hypothetical protein
LIKAVSASGLSHFSIKNMWGQRPSHRRPSLSLLPGRRERPAEPLEPVLWGLGAVTRGYHSALV